jgi:hypothetical protein
MVATSNLSSSVNEKLVERRECYRMPAAHAGASRVEMFFRTPEERRCRARLVNVSAGGLLCRLAYTGPLPSLHESVSAVHVFRHQQDPLSFTGTVRRLEINTSGLFCAVEFSAMLPALTSAFEEYSQPPSERLFVPTTSRMAPAFTINPENFIGRLYTVPGLTPLQNGNGMAAANEQLRRRSLVSSAFRDIVGNLPETEHWWFFHIVAMLKETEPEYPAELLAEYLRLCRKSCDSRQFNVSA